MTHLQAGEKAPDFSVSDQNGNPHSLGDYAGKKLVLFFYPKASTPGCTTQACNLSDNYDRFRNQGYEILGISADAPLKLQKFIQKYKLPFPLLADEDRSMLNAYGVWGMKKFMGRQYEGIIRTTFVIDENGNIAEIIDQVKTKAHSDQILKS